MEYIKCIEGLRETLNKKRDKQTSEKLINFLGILKNDFGKSVSTKFLKNLMGNERSNRQKTYRMSYLLRKANLKTTRKNRYFRNWINSTWKGTITEYGHNDKPIYKNPCELSEPEQEQLNQIKGIENICGIALFPKPLKDLDERQHRRNGINKGGGVFIKNFYSQTFGREARANKKEVLYFVVI